MLIWPFSRHQLPVSNRIKMSSLQDQILEHYAWSKFDNPKREFLPEGWIANLLTRQAIITDLELEQSTLEKKDGDLVDFIFQHGKKLFAILIVMDLSRRNKLLAMNKFKQTTPQFTDKSLPLKEDARLDCFNDEPWTNLRRSNFLTTQWTFLAPVFSTTNFQLKLEPNCILPFTWKSDDVKGGAFSQVFEVTIHEDHQETPVLTVRPQSIHLPCQA
jgi:hypothetical protein